MTASPAERTGDRLRLTIRVTPRASRDSIAGTVVLADGRSALSVRIAAPPADGAANKALTHFLARSLKLPRSSIRIVSGETARLKIVELEDAPEDAVDRLLGLAG